jgi:hypothetical protein
LVHHRAATWFSRFTNRNQPIPEASMNVRTAAHSCALLAAALLTSLAAHGQLFRAYVSSAGNDANTCSLPAPCRLLPAALAAVGDGGEIWMLDSANYNTSTVTVTKSVSILAVPGVVGSVVATGGGSAISVNAPGKTVSLRNLVVVALGAGTVGVDFAAGTMLNVNDCQISGMSAAGINANASNSSALNVRDTIVRDSTNNINIGTNITATIDHVQVTGGTYGVFVSGSSIVTVVNSNLSGMIDGALSYAIGGNQIRLLVERTVISGVSNYGILSSTGGAGSSSVVVSRGNSIIEAANAALAVYQDTSSNAVVTADGNFLSGSINAFLFLNGAGGIFTMGNNTLVATGSGPSGGTITPASTF